MEILRKKIGFICDMDGVIYHGNRLLPGVKEFVEWLYREKKRFLFLTNSSERTPRELQQKLSRMGLEVDEKHILHQRAGHGKVRQPAGPGLQRLRHRRAGTVQRHLRGGNHDRTTSIPYYVIVGETQNYNYESILHAVELIEPRREADRHEHRSDRPV